MAIGFAGDVAAESSDGVLDAALLPRRAGIAEPGIEPELAFDLWVAGEFRAVIEGNGSSCARRDRAQHPHERGGDGIGLEAVLTHRDGEPRRAFVCDDHRMSGLGEEHGVCLPMPGFLAGGDMRRPIVDRGAGSARPSAFGAPAPLVLGARQIMPPPPVVGALELGMDEAVDRLVADDPVAGLAGEAA
ncbi:MAG: hypothetical protein PGN12_07910 [Sphingomonas phyllosphaerae]